LRRSASHVQERGLKKERARVRRGSETCEGNMSRRYKRASGHVALRFTFSALAPGPQLLQVEALGEEEVEMVVVVAVEEKDKAEEK
jgi:hypothetical protein